MWLGRDCIWMGLEKHFDLFFTPPEPLLSFFSSSSSPKWDPRATVVWMFTRPVKWTHVFISLADEQHFYKMNNELIKWQNDKCIKSEFWVFSSSLSCFQCISVCVCFVRLLRSMKQRKQLTPAFLLALCPEYLDEVQIRNQPFKPAWCNDKLEGELKVGLKTMLEKGSGRSRGKKKRTTRKSRKTREREKQRGWNNEWEVSRAWPGAQRQRECCARIMWIHCLGWKLPGWLDGLFIERWRHGLMSKSFGEEMGWEQERKISFSFLMPLSAFNRDEERGEKGKESVWNRVFGLDPAC